MIILQERDLRILRLAREHRFVTVDQVKPLFGSGRTRQCTRRVLELRQEGYLKPDPLTHLEGASIFRLTPLGLKTAASGSTLSIRPQQYLDLPTLKHESIITSVRVILEEAWKTGRFVPEQAIKNQDFRQIPDGVYFFENGRGVALEVENSLKSEKRFLKLHERWEEEPAIFFVLFIATSPDLYEAIKARIPKVQTDQPFGLVLWDDLKAGTDQIWSPERTWSLAELKARLG